MMKAIIYINIALMSLLSCKAQKVGNEVICGTFYKLNKEKHFSTSYTLKLNIDTTFTFIIRVQDGQPQCSGTWEMKDNKFIILKCSEITDVAEMLTNGYMSKREHNIQVLSKNKLKYDDVILKRKK